MDSRNGDCSGLATYKCRTHKHVSQLSPEEGVPDIYLVAPFLTIYVFHPPDSRSGDRQ